MRRAGNRNGSTLSERGGDAEGSDEGAPVVSQGCRGGECGRPEKPWTCFRRGAGDSGGCGRSLSMVECRSRERRQSCKGRAGGPHQNAKSTTTQARAGASRCVFKAEGQQAGARQIDQN